MKILNNLIIRKINSLGSYLPYRVKDLIERRCTPEKSFFIAPAKFGCEQFSARTFELNFML